MNKTGMLPPHPHVSVSIPSPTAGITSANNSPHPNTHSHSHHHKHSNHSSLPSSARHSPNNSPGPTGDDHNNNHNNNNNNNNESDSHHRRRNSNSNNNNNNNSDSYNIEPRHSSRKRQPSALLRDMLNTSDTEESFVIKRGRASTGSMGPGGDINKQPYTGKRRGRPPKNAAAGGGGIYLDHSQSHNHDYYEPIINHNNGSNQNYMHQNYHQNINNHQFNKFNRSKEPHVLVIYRTVEKETTDFYVCPKSRISKNDLSFLDDVHGEGANDEAKLPILLNLLRNGEWEKVGHLVFGDQTNGPVNLYDLSISAVYAVAFLSDSYPPGSLGVDQMVSGPGPLNHLSQMGPPMPMPQPIPLQNSNPQAQHMMGLNVMHPHHYQQQANVNMLSGGMNHNHNHNLNDLSSSPIPLSNNPNNLINPDIHNVPHHALSQNGLLMNAGILQPGP